jgi:acyl-coenzyme A synthetase/AMP-(fatty) acid ligase
VGRLWNVYGPTETTIWSTSWPVPADVDEVSIGRPIANTRAYVLDARQEPVPVGVPGELYLGGAGLAFGYLGREDLTRQRFVEVGGERLYRTGDVVRYREDGNLVCLGRLDDQVKIRGYRIEPGEIEARLAEHPAVSGAAVVVRLDEAGEPQLLACVVGDAGPAELRAHLARTLPDHLVPAHYVGVPTLPLTPNGKLDRRALPELPRTPATAPSAEPADELTGQVAAICAEVLRRETVGPHDSLFDLGAHSLTMTAIASRIRRRLGADLPLHLFYDDPTAATLAAAASVELAQQIGQGDRVE